METLKYKIIKSKRQYNEYCTSLDELLNNHSKSKVIKDEIELLTFLIEKWDEEHNSFHESDPVELLKSLMNEQDIKPISLAEMLNVSKGLVSDILNYKKGLSKENIRKLSEKFKLSHEAFNRHYELVGDSSTKQNVKTATHRRKIAA